MKKLLIILKEIWLAPLSIVFLVLSIVMMVLSDDVYAPLSWFCLFLFGFFREKFLFKTGYWTEVPLYIFKKKLLEKLLK